MSDLVPYNIKYASIAQGMHNNGNSCYFNSIMQCLLSCTPIMEVLEMNKDKEHIKRNPLAIHLLYLSSLSIEGKDLKGSYYPIWQTILNISKSQKNRIRMDLGQQDAHEGLMILFDALETIPEVRSLFEHRHLIKIKCGTCNEWVMEKKEENLIFEVQPDLKTEQHEDFKNIDDQYNITLPLNEFLRKQNGYVDKDYICPKCGDKGGYKFKTTTLTMVPEILPVVLKKYKRKMLTPFPYKLEFIKSGGNKKYIYILCAQSEHSGNTAGGHYWAICLRKENNKPVWKKLNDSMVLDGKPGPTPNTYILFYCYSHTEDIKSG